MRRGTYTRVVSPAWPPSDNSNDVLLLQTATGFRALAAPTTTGRSDEVTALRPVPGGRAQFLVQNGQPDGTADGPVQLIAYVG